jgi:hypothetical protein
MKTKPTAIRQIKTSLKSFISHPPFFRVIGSGYEVQGSKVQGSGFRVQGSKVINSDHFLI